MAKCEICNRDMLKAKGCFDKDYQIDGQRYQAIPYIDRFGERADCHDCGASEGHYHHTGCDMERCPKCSGQFISCDCDIAEELIVYVGKRKGKISDGH